VCCIQPGNDNKCPFCNSDQNSRTDEEIVEELKKRVDVNDAGAIYLLGNWVIIITMDILVCSKIKTRQ
jgi:hypothetical protein